MNDFDFGFEVENENDSLGQLLWLLIRVFALAFSAMTTGAFFWRYVGDLSTTIRNTHFFTSISLS
jgi:hypothetical protein